MPRLKRTIYPKTQMPVVSAYIALIQFVISLIFTGCGLATGHFGWPPKCEVCSGVTACSGMPRGVLAR